MPELYLFRHGESGDNKDGILGGRRDVGLTRTGEQQAFLLACRLKRAVDLGSVSLPSSGAVVCSDLSRASGTGEIVTRHLQLPSPRPLSMLRERDLGLVSDKTFEEARKIIADRHKIRSAKGVTYVEGKYGMESFAAITERGGNFIDFFRRRFGDAAVGWAFVHGDIGLGITAAYTGTAMRTLVDELHMCNTGAVRLKEGGYELLDFSGVLTMNT